VVAFLEEFSREQKAVNQALLEYTKPTKTKRDCAASRMPSTVRDKYFKCAKVDLLVELDRLRTYGSADKTEKLFNEVFRYSTVMQERFTRGEREEKKYVQTEIKDVFWLNTRTVLYCDAAVELCNERGFTVVMEDEDDRSTITGLTDHTIKMRTCDFHVLTIEDKYLGLVIDKSDVGQAKCEMVEELREMDVNLQYVPVEYCGILQNGVSWVFLFHKVRHGRVMWNYVVAPDTFADGVVNEDSCRIVARFLEHAYCVADDIVTNIGTPRRAVVATSLLDTVGDGDESDGDEGGAGEGEESDTDNRGAPKAAARTERTEVKKDVPRQQNTRSAEGKTKSVALEFGCDENLFLPFTAENVRKQPIQFYKLVL
jgi:hypothetical protein